MGGYALPLSCHFGNLSLDAPPDVKAVYFDLLGVVLIHYSYQWITR